METVDKVILSLIFLIVLTAVVIAIAASFKTRGKPSKYITKGKWFEQHDGKYV